MVPPDEWVVYLYEAVSDMHDLHNGQITSLDTESNRTFVLVWFCWVDPTGIITILLIMNTILF